jgi:hypothetical protein
MHEPVFNGKRMKEPGPPPITPDFLPGGDPHRESSTISVDPQPPGRLRPAHCRSSRITSSCSFSDAPPTSRDIGPPRFDSIRAGTPLPVNWQGAIAARWIACPIQANSPSWHDRFWPTVVTKMVWQLRQREPGENICIPHGPGGKGAFRHHRDQIHLAPILLPLRATTDGLQDPRPPW